MERVDMDFAPAEYADRLWLRDAIGQQHVTVSVDPRRKIKRIELGFTPVAYIEYEDGTDDYDDAIGREITIKLTPVFLSGRKEEK